MRHRDRCPAVRGSGRSHSPGRYLLAILAVTAAGAAELVVDLDARDIQRGSTVWRNRAGRGDFTCLGAPGLKVIDNVTAVTFDGQKDACRGPVAPAELVGASPRAVTVWAYNLPPDEREKTVIAWGRRGGPDGTLFSLNCGTHQFWGAATHWGADLGWYGCYPTTGRWRRLGYVYDGARASVWLDDIEASAREMTLRTHAGATVNLAVQNEADGSPVFGRGFTGPLAIAAVRVYQGALTNDQVRTGFADEAAALGLAPAGQGGRALSDGRPPVMFLDTGGHSVNICTMSFTPDGRHLLTGSSDRALRVWRVDDGACERVIRMAVQNPGSGSVIGLNALADGRRALVVTDQTPRLYDWTEGKLLGCMSDVAGTLLSAAVSPDEGLTAVSCFGGSTYLFDTGSGRYLGAYGGWDGQKETTAFSPDGAWVAAAGATGRINVWSLRNQPHRVIGGLARPASIDWSPDGRLIAVAEPNRVRLFDGASLAEVRSFTVDGGWWLKALFSPDGRHLAVTSAGGTVLDAATGQPVVTVGAGSSRTLAWSPDGDRVAFGSWDGAVRVVEFPSGRVLWERDGGGSRFRSLAWSPDSRSVGWSWGSTSASVLAGSDQKPLDGVFRLDALSAEPSPEAAGGWQRAVLKQGNREIRMAPNYRIQVLDGGSLTATMAEPSRAFSGTLTPSGRVLGGTWRRIVEFGRANREYVGHSQEINALAVSPDGRYLASGGSDRIIVIWSLNEPDGALVPLVRVFVDRNREWITWTEDGYYACSPNGERMIGWQLQRGLREQPEYYPAYQLRDRLYRPDIIARLLEAGSVDGAIRLADANRKVATDPQATVANLARIAPPKVTIVSPADGSTVAAPQVSIVAKVVDPNGRAIREVKVFRNGRAETTRGMRPKLTGPDGVQREMALAPGLNVLSVVAVNDAGLESCPVGVVVKYQPAPQADLRQSRLHLLAVGVSRYRQADLSLRYAAKDARDLAALLAAQQGKLYDEVKAKVLTDAEATRGNVLDALDQMGRQAEVRDTCLLFLAGHGVADDQQRYFFLPSDGDPDRLARSGLRWSELTAMVADLPGKVILALDTCHSGSVEGTRGLRPVLAYNDAIREAGATEVGVVTLASCQANELSLEREEWANGAFTKALLEAFEGKADVTGDGEVSLAELEVYVLERVKLLTAGRQHPTMVRAPTIPGSLPVVRLK